MNRTGCGARGRRTSISAVRLACCIVALTDIAHELFVEVFGAGEHAARDDVALNLSNQFST
jgi:hypothetical protein